MKCQSRRNPLGARRYRRHAALFLLSPILFSSSILAQSRTELSHATEAPRIFTASKLDASCRTFISQPADQHDLESQLRNHGVTVTKAGTAGLTASTDCVAAGRSHGSGIVVHQCLDFSQVVSLPDQAKSVAVASTWRNCQAFSCDVGKCEAAMQSNVHSLVERFVADYHDRLATEHPAKPQVERVVPDQTSLIVGVSPGLRMAYYGAYILTCMIVILRWGLRNQLN
jgi:hypothetical protein